MNEHSKIFIIGAVILAGLALSAFFGYNYAYKNVAAVVGNDFIMKAEVERQQQLNVAASKVTKDVTYSTFEAAKKQLVDRDIIQIIAEEKGVDVSDTELNNEIKRIADEKYDGNTEFVYQGYQQAYGYTKDEIERQIYGQLLEEKVKSKLVNNVTAKYIAIKDIGHTSFDLANVLMNQIKEGESFDSIYDKIVYEKGYEKELYSAGVWNALIYDHSKFDQDVWDEVLKASLNQVNGPYKDKNYYNIIFPTAKVTGENNSFQALYQSYKDKYYYYDMENVRNVFASLYGTLVIQKAHACVLCWADNAHTCALFYCKCNDCKSKCGPDSNHAQAPTCPSGERCTLSPYVACEVWPGTEYCNNAGCGTGGPVTPPPQAVNGVCGVSDDKTFVWDEKPTSGLCRYGSPTAVTKDVRDGTDRWNWKCTGSNGGSTSSCSADIAYNLKVNKEGCGTGRVTDDRDPHKINCGSDCGGNYTGQWVELKQNPVTGNIFVAWEKLWAGASDCKDNIFCNISMADNRKVEATFGYSVKVTINGKGKVVDNRTPHKISCENTDPNATKTCNLQTYSATGLKLIASATDANYPFIKWSNEPCDGQTNTTCDFGTRCKNSNLIIANFRNNPVTISGCSVTPTSGSAPLVVRVEWWPGSISKNNITMGDGTTRTNIPTPFYYTYPSTGSREVKMQIDENNNGIYEANEKYQSCGIVNISNPNSSQGGEVAP